MAKLSCPLCLNAHFANLDALRTTLVAATTAEIQCPVCQEPQRGLDKFTIHLFTHLATSQPGLLHTQTPIASASTALNGEEIRSAGEMTADRKIPAVPASVVALEGFEEEITNAQNEIANEQRTLRCDICNFSFSDENILDMHQKLLHQTLEDKQTGLYSYHCHLCSKKFKMKGSLMVHLRVAHYGFGHNIKSDQDLLGGFHKLKKPDEDKTADPPKKWSCDVCQKLFTTKYFLKKHKRLHTGEMPYFCVQCNKYFTFQQTYRKHMLYHSSEKPHVCTECGRAFKELSTLHNHERIHSGERPFACEFCGKCFRQRVSYLVHKRIHTGVMPYKCTACGKSYRYKVSQRSHKCTAIPPGNVVKTPEPNAHSTITEVAELSVQDSIHKENLGLPLNVNPNVNIVINSNGEVVGQNFTFDGENLITFYNNFSTASQTQGTGVEGGESKLMSTSQPETAATYAHDVANGVKGDVTALTAHTSKMYISDDKISNEMATDEKLHTINEESLKQLLYGAVHP